MRPGNLEFKVASVLDSERKTGPPIWSAHRLDGVYRTMTTGKLLTYKLKLI